MTTTITLERLVKLLQIKYQAIPPQTSRLPGFLTVEELALLLNMSQQTIRNILCRRPKLFPKPVRFAGLRRIYFPFDDVASHLYRNYLREEAKINIAQTAQ